jgi:hypothetical protein
MTPEKRRLLYESEDGEVIGLDEVQLLDPIPERIAPLRALLAGPDEYEAYQAALILAAWGDAQGAQHLSDTVLAARAGGPPLDPHRIRATDDEAPDLAAEALHLYGTRSGDMQTRDDGYRRGLSLFGDISFPGRLQSVLRRDRPAALLSTTRAAYERTVARGLDETAATLLPALAAMGEPEISRLITDRAEAIQKDLAIQRGLLEAASDLKRKDIEALVMSITSPSH